MSVIFTRSALEFWGAKNIPTDLVYLHRSPFGDTTVVTRGDLRRRQQEAFARKLAFMRPHPWRAFKVWVCFVSGFIFGGWQAFIENRDDCHWVDRDRRWLKEPLMRLFPLVLIEDFDQWKRAFAEQYRRRTQCGKPVGVAYVWWNERDAPRLAASTPVRGPSDRLNPNARRATGSTFVEGPASSAG